MFKFQLRYCGEHAIKKYDHLLLVRSNFKRLIVYMKLTANLEPVWLVPDRSNCHLMVPFGFSTRFVPVHSKQNLYFRTEHLHSVNWGVCYKNILNKSDNFLLCFLSVGFQRKSWCSTFLILFYRQVFSNSPPPPPPINNYWFMFYCVYIEYIMWEGRKFG